MSRKIRDMKQNVSSNLEKKKDKFDKDMKKKLKILRSRIRSFWKSEVSRILAPCTREIWEAVRNPKTGVHSLTSLRVKVGLKKYTLYPPNRRVPKRGPKKISKARKYDFSFDRLLREDRIEHFKAFVNK